MKIKPIFSFYCDNKILLSSFTIASSLFISPIALATIHNNTVNLNMTTVSNGDAIVTSDTTALSSIVAGGAALELGTGSIAIQLTTSAASKAVYGANLANQKENNFGNGSSVIINQNTTGSSSYYTNGISLSNKTNLSASALNLVINATTYAKGIVGNTNNVINLGDNSIINVTSSAGIATGVSLGASGQFTANAVELNIKSQSTVTGIDSSGAGVDLGSNSKITLESSSNTGISSAINLSGNSILSANALSIKGKNAKGINANGTSTINLGSNSIIGVSEGSGISTNGTDVNINADQLTIETSGNNYHGINLNNGSHNTNLGSNSNITTTGNDAHGIWMIGRSDGLLTADALTIHTTGSNANALEVRKGTAIIGDGSVLIAENGGALVASSSGGIAANATINNSKLISGGSYAASAQQTGAVINLNNIEATVDRHGARAYALWAVSDGVINANGVKVNAATGVYAMVANAGGKTNLSGEIIINSIDAAMIANSSTSYIKGTGKMTITGQIAAQNLSLIDLNMTSGSVLNGAVNQSTNGVANLTMDNSIWRFDNHSNVNNLQLTNNSNVIFDTSTDGLLTVNNLSGNGQFTMRTDIVNATGDLLNITGTTTGNHTVKVVNNGSIATDSTETLTIITSTDGLGHFTLTNQVELGGYLYNLRPVGDNWELYSSGKVPPSFGGGGSVTPSADASANMLNASYLLNYAETQTLLQRMGDLRQGNNTGHVWARTFYGDFSSFDNSQLTDFDMNYSGLQLGADKATAQNNAILYSGVFVSLSNSSQNYEDGDGSLKSQSIGLYSSYILNSGTYLDGILKYQHHRSKLNVTDTQGDVINGNGSSSGLSLSVEGGHRFHLNADQSGLYVEPQLQLTYVRQGSSRIDNSNGLTVDLDSYNALLGRAGALIGYQVNSADKTPVNLYFKNSWLHEFKGNTSFKLNGSKESFSFKGGAWVSGVGISTQLQKQHTLFLDVETTTGNKFNQNQINAGYRYSF